jgi:hypothetical protein
MEPMYRHVVMEHLKQYAGVADPAEITTFRGYRADPDGATVELTVDVYDRGRGQQRWSVVARTADGRATTGDPGSTLDECLAAVRWGRLDDPA